MQKIDPLIRTKLRLPFIRPGLVPRPRLQEQVAQGLCGPLTLITAPAGFGKTTLAASGIAAVDMPVAWLSLAKNDNQENRFLNYLIAALQGVDSQIGNEAAQLMQGTQSVPAEALLTSLINDLETAGRDIVLVLDDYQFINKQVVHEAVTFLLEHCPHTFHLVILSRSDPPLPLARLRVRGQMIELRAADLRFTETEASQFLNHVMGLHLDPGSVAMLEERTEGWIAGLQMAALSLRNREDVRGFIEGFSGTNRYILDYLLEEILAKQLPEIQRFLLYTSVLERLTAPLCDVLLANDLDPQPDNKKEKFESGSPSLPLPDSVLEYLERENIFLVSLDDERTWFRYHHLFADLLKARLIQTHPELVPRLHTRASVWLEQQGFILEAIEHLLAAHETERGADLIERHGALRWAENDISIVQMAENLPTEMLIARPKIGIYHAWFLIIQGRIGKALPLLKELAQYLAGSNPASGQRWTQTVIASALAFLSPSLRAPSDDLLPDYQLLDEIPVEEPILRNAADILYAMTLARRREYDRAVKVALKCIQREQSFQGVPNIPTLVPFLTRIYLVQGHLHESASLCREYLNLTEERGLLFNYATGGMEIDLGEVLYEWNRLEEAELHIRDGLRANELWMNIMTDGFGLIALIRVLQARRNYTEAMQVLEKLENRFAEPSRPREFEEAYRTLRVRIQLASGDVQYASDWADQIQRSQDFNLHPERYRLTLARIRTAQGRYAEVEELLAGMEPVMTAGSQISRLLETNLLLAVALANQQRSSEAFELLEASLALAEPEGYIRAFLDVGEPAWELLGSYLRTDAEQHKNVAQKIMNAFSRSGRADSPAQQSHDLVEPLSERELEVLHLIALGKTNQEIAEQLIVARGTIKAHAASIYRKLDVANRTEAVARARELDILP